MQVTIYDTYIHTNFCLLDRFFVEFFNLEKFINS